MEWDQLLNIDRLGCPIGKAADATRTDFERDFDRIVFSGAFRRLHGKTQVHPIPESDMTHTRLTHSLEASCVARSLGRIVAAELDLEKHSRDIAAVVAAATLAHDIGNPPFGHKGEDAIREFFDDPSNEVLLSGLSEGCHKELLKFEGNALGFRLLVNQKPYETSNPGGLGLTNATLATFLKYPTTEGSASSHFEKYGVFHDDFPSLETVARATGLLQIGEQTWARHPLAFLSEAADDICYRIMDWEDGYKLKLLTFEEAAVPLEQLVVEGGGELDGLTKIKSKNQKIGYLRARAINSLVSQAATVFSSDIETIMIGERSDSLLKSIPSRATVKSIKDRSIESIYTHKPVLQIEAAGFEVLGKLLALFIDAVVAKKKSAKQQTIYKLIPSAYVEAQGSEWTESTRVLNVCEFVASMTDTFAVDLYRTLSGISLPNYQP